MENRGAGRPPVAGAETTALPTERPDPAMPPAVGTTGWMPLEADQRPSDPGSDAPDRVRPRWRRAGKVILIAAAAGVLVVGGLALAAYLTASHYLNSMKRIGNPFSSIPASARPAPPAGAAAKDTTFLVGGLDTRSPVPTTGRHAQPAMRGRTDTLMLVHLLAGGRGAYLVSIPRDSWVQIPGYGHGKINWAYYFGGPALAVRTVEHLTHVRIDHVAVIDWAGFRTVTDALGGVTLNIPLTTYDPANHVTWTAGTHHLDGQQALLYVRDRYGLSGGDFARERRQQYFLRAVFMQLRKTGKLTNPLQEASVLRALSQAVSVDSTLSNARLTSLALSLRGLNTGGVVFATAPTDGTGAVGSQSVVWLNGSIGQAFWHAFEYDSLPSFMRAHKLAGLGSTTP